MMRYDHLGRNKQTITSSSEVEKRAIGQKCRIVSAIVRRRMSGWTKEEVAKRAGLKQSAVARLENSPKIPRFDTLQKVAFGLGLCLELVTDDNEEAAATAQ
jgi:ribosome-binding protein aMBF1 (putative translation factor)